MRASVRKEERIIDTLEPVMNQHKLIIDPKVWEYDYASNPDAPPEKTIGVHARISNVPHV